MHSLISVRMNKCALHIVSTVLLKSNVFSSLECYSYDEFTCSRYSCSSVLHFYLGILFESSHLQVCLVLNFTKISHYVCHAMG